MSLAFESIFDELTKYVQKDHFFFEPEESLKEKCNAPTDKSGVYIVYALAKGKVKLVYIGRSGKLKKDGSIFIRKAGLGGMKDRIVNGHQFGKVPRKYSWPMQMQKETIEALDVYWYVTHGNGYNDDPVSVENKLLKMYLGLYGELPRWNKEYKKSKNECVDNSLFY